MFRHILATTLPPKTSDLSLSGVSSAVDSARVWSLLVRSVPLTVHVSDLSSPLVFHEPHRSFVDSPITPSPAPQTPSGNLSKRGTVENVTPESRDHRSRRAPPHLHRQSSGHLGPLSRDPLTPDPRRHKKGVPSPGIENRVRVSPYELGVF